MRRQPDAGGTPPAAGDADGNESAGLLDGWMSRAEVAADLGISVDTLQRWETQRIGPPSIRLGRRVFYRADTLREWLKARETGASAGAGLSRRIAGGRR